MMGIGISMVPGHSWIHAYFAMSALLLTGSSFTLAKMLRDRHEADVLDARMASPGPRSVSDSLRAAVL